MASTHSYSSEIALTRLESSGAAHVEDVQQVDEIGATAATQRPQQFSLPPVDGGRDAWLCLAGCFFIEALVWGFPFSFGIFQKYYSSTEPFASDPNSIAVIGTSATGIMYLSCPFLFAFMKRYPQYRRHCNIIGLPIISGALIASSFATSTAHLILTQGVLYGVGGMLFYTPVIVILEEWFVRRKGLAFGIMWAGTGFAGVTIPFFLAAALERWGSATALRIWAAALVVLSAPFLPFLKPRLPVSRDAPRADRRIDLRFLRSPAFLIPQVASIVQGLGYFIPSLYLPSYTSSLGLDPIVGTVCVALVNAASVAGTILVGHLIDRLHFATVVMLVTAPTVFAIFVVWGLSISLPALLVFSILYGVSAGGFSTTWTGNVKYIQSKVGGDTGVIFGFLAAGRGIGAVASGPLSEALLSKGTFESASWGYGTEYGGLIVFTGCTAAVGGISFLARRVGWI